MIQQPHRTRRLRRASCALAACVAALVAFIFLASAGHQARADAPKVTAGFQTTERLVVQLQVPGDAKAKALDTEVALVGPGGEVLQQRTVQTSAGETVVRFDALNTPAQHVFVRVRRDGKTSERILSEVLLVKPHETVLAGPTEFYAGSSAEFRCTVQSVRSLTESAPIPNATVTITFTGSDGKAKTIYTGKTDAKGNAQAQFQTPDVTPGNYRMTVVTRSNLGEETLTRDVKVLSDLKVLLTTDKPIYQPGQTIRMRTLALQSFDLRPVSGQALLLEVEDAKGNKVFKRQLKTSAYGVASADFVLADEVNMGDFRIRAVVGPQTADKSVNVKRYVLPKFKSALTADKKFYLPKETIKGSLQVDYVFGKPVAGGTVEIKASTFDVAFKDFHTFKGKTDATGKVEFEITLPDYFVGQPLSKGDAIVKLDAKVTDTAEHAETITRTYPVSDKSIKVSLIAEGGRLVPDMANRVFVAALYPDGSPAADCSVTVFEGDNQKGKKLATLKTNDAGLAEFDLTPDAKQFRHAGWGQRNAEMLGGVQQRWSEQHNYVVNLSASDTRGNKAELTSTLNGEVFGENIVLRMDKAIYKGGDRLGVDVRSSAGMSMCYLDIVKGGQTIVMRTLDVKDGKAASHLDLPANLFGTMEVHAYQVLASGEIIRDTRVVYVNQADALKIQISADKDEYRPGQDGVIRFEVTDAKGTPTAAALGVIIVDEAVYALQEMQPGLEKVYFTLQDELLKPRTQVVFNPNVGLDQIIQQPVVPVNRQQVAAALLTAVKPKAPAVWRTDPAGERMRQVRTRVQQVAAGLVNYAVTQSRTVLELSKENANWVFQPDLLARATKAGHVNKQQLGDGLGGELTLADMQRFDKELSAEALARTVTETRMSTLVWATWNAIHRTPQSLVQWQKDKKWQPPADAMTQAAKASHFGEAGGFDGWGRALKFVARAEKNNPSGIPFFDEWTIVSAGADGKFDTKDDIQLSSVQIMQRGGFAGRLGRTREQFQFGMAPWGRGGMPIPGGIGGGGDPRAFNMAMPLRAAEGGLERRDAVRDMAVPKAVPTDLAAEGKSSGGQGGAAPPRLREYFPETLLWRPEVITDERGRGELRIPFADSITTWRLTASASSRNGLLGGTTAPLKVFQDFFVDLDLPVALTQNDEVAFPVAVYNYLKGPQTITLELKREPWFTLLDDSNIRTLKLEANQVTAVRFRIKANKVGNQPLQVEARGSKMSDAVRRSVEILPDGVAVEQVFTDRLKGNVSHTVNVPAGAIDGASRLLVKVYPGVHSQLLEGTEAMLRMPNGCFEQTSSAAYPNILVTDYLKRTKQGSPATLMKAETFLSAGYQRLLTFERPGGGFDWWGSGEPLVWLSAYGLQEFSDMAKVYPVDPGIINRTRQFLFAKQNTDGTWDKIGATHGVSIEQMGDPKLLLTSYVSWSLLDSATRPAGWEKSEEFKRIEKAIGYVRENAPKSESAYVLALAANALASWDAKDDSTHDACLRVLRKLDDLKQRKADWKANFFPAKGQSLAYGRGDYLTVETTALAVLAMVKNGQFTPTVNDSLTYLIKSKEGNGCWGSTQATILALKALIAGAGGQAPKGDINFQVSVGGKQVAQSKLTPDNFDVLQQFDLREHLKAGDNTVAIEVKGESAALYQIVGRNFVPRDKKVQQEKSILDVKVDYDRTKLSTSDLLKAKATMKYSGKVATYQVIVDLPVPPGFTVDAGDFAEMVASKKIERFTVTARQVTLYVGQVRPDSEHVFEYALRPKYPLRAQAPAAIAYEYYTPSNRAASLPVALEVTDKK